MYATSFREVVRPTRGLQRLRSLARYCALSARGLITQPSKPPRLRLLYCHYVFDDQRAEFEAIVRYLQSIGEFIGTDDVLEFIEGERSTDHNLFHLSFDDGFRNVFTNALPILREHGVPAAFFVPTAIISAKQDIVERYCRLTMNYPCIIEMATWDDLESACAAGLEVGSHTRTHVRFSEISACTAAIEDEIFGSKEDLERRLGRNCNYISWPYGRITDADVQSLRSVEQAGYRACFGAFRGHLTPNVTDRFRIPRHHFEVQWPLPHVKCFAHGAMEQ